MIINTRSAREEDFSEIIKMFPEFASFQKVPEKMKNTLDQMIIEKEFFRSLVAETSEGQLAGYAVFFYSYRTWVGKCLYMDDLFVREVYRGKGFGKMLMEKVFDLARQENCKKVCWQVSKSNWNKKAQEFYKNLGTEIDEMELNCELLIGKNR